MKRMLVFFYLGLLTFGGVFRTEGHAFLERAAPGVGSTVKGSPEKVSIQFTEAVEPAFSKIQVFDAAGKEVDKGDAHPSAQNRLEISLRSLAPGTYTVVWRVVSVDTHVTKGKFSFVVTR